MGASRDPLNIIEALSNEKKEADHKYGDGNIKKI